MVNSQISLWMEAHREDFLRDLAALVAIPSVAKDQDDPHAPYGEDCARVLHHMLQLAESYGFATENIENRIGRIIYSPETDRDIGIWGHLDVVEAGANWQKTQPFTLLQEGDWLFGRGVRDDKGPTLAALYALLYLKEHRIPCPRGLSLYVGTSEETGLKDVAWFVETGHRCPGWSLVVDSAWPMSRGEKGMLSVDLFSGKTFSPAVPSLQGGAADSAVPSFAWAEVEESFFSPSALEESEAITVQEASGGIRICAKGRACHTAFPGGGINAIGLLAQQMLRQERLPAEDLSLWQEIFSFAGSNTGAAAGIDACDPEAGEVTCVATTLKVLQDNTLKLHLNIRYPAITSGEIIRAGLESWCRQHDWRITVLNAMDAYMLPCDHPMVVTLMDTYNDIMQTNAKPIILSGGTYAGKLPSAVGYGMGGSVPQGIEDVVPRGHGHPHGPDECGRLSSLLTGAGIYAEALTRLAAMDG